MSHGLNFCHDATWVLHQKQINPGVAINKQFRLKLWFYLHWRRQGKQNLFQSVPKRHYGNHPESTCCTADGTQIGRGTAKKMHIESQLLTQISFQLQVHVMQKNLKSWFFKGQRTIHLWYQLRSRATLAKIFLMLMMMMKLSSVPVAQNGTVFLFFEIFYWLRCVPILFVQSANSSILGSPFAWTYSILQALRCLHINMLLL